MTVPADRLTAVDIYRYLDWLGEAFEAGDQLVEIVVQGRLRVVRQRDFQLRRLELVLQHLNASHHQQAMALVAELKRALVADGVPWREILRRLHRVVHDWEAARPKYVCDFQYAGFRCAIAFRTELQRAAHRSVVHDIHEEQEAA